MMIEYGEPLHIYLSCCFIIFIGFLFYLMLHKPKKAQKNRPN
ncbi:hypothetical protein [Planococcus beigongshangi]|nr:hypothetical protein [Planococcus beigongshangi]